MFTTLGAVAAASKVFALPGDKFRISMSSHMFTPMKPHPEMGIKMAARFGFHGLEPFAEDIKQYLSQPPEVFKNPDFERGLKMFVSPDGKAVRLIITHQGDPASVEGIEHAGLRDTLMDQVVAWLAARK